MGNANGPEMYTKETYSVKLCKTSSDKFDCTAEYSKEHKGAMGSINFAPDAANTLSTLRSITEQGISYFTGGSTGGSTEVAVKKE